MTNETTLPPDWKQAEAGASGHGITCLPGVHFRIHDYEAVQRRTGNPAGTRELMFQRPAPPARRANVHYAPAYNMGFFGLEKAHPFDTKKSGRALAIVRDRIGRRALENRLVPVSGQVTSADLRLIHTQKYLESLSSSREMAHILEIPAIARLPFWLVNNRLRRPMRIAVQGTIEAARSAMETGLAINLLGGFHHASHDRGGGFCLYADAMIAVRVLQRELILGSRDRVLHVDLDAHQGNGVARACAHLGMDEVYILDMYCDQIYPGDHIAADRVDLAAPLPIGTGDSAYLQTLKRLLPQALEEAKPALTIYNAGTDILAGDPLGCLDISAAGVIERDRYVIESCKARGIPLLVVPSGGYMAESHKLIAEMLLLAFGDE